MKIKTITCHHVYNYGASLQAYALQTYLASFGHDVEIIDYQPEYKEGKYKFIHIPYSSKYYALGRKSFLLRLIYSVCHHRWHIYRTWSRKKAFDLFKKDWLCCTDSCYGNVDELRSNPPSADIYVAGSDQIWNTGMENGRDAAYYADFGGAGIYRMAYAASFGVETIEEDYKDFVRSEILKLNAVSVREKSGVDILDGFGIDNCMQVIDPVFLRTKDEWDTLASEAKKYNLDSCKYILVYDFLNDSRVARMAGMLKERTGLPIISVNDYITMKYADENINDAGPLEFVSLVKNAAYVVANSFHGTAFAIIYNKLFYTYSLARFKNSSRMRDFLSLLGLEERFNAECIVEGGIDYTSINKNVDLIVENSKKWIHDRLQEAM